ncbi:MAG TPA: hypothetical protein VFP00_01005 [Burkholderiales bacterium]|nr:hypothetical protein [Burkholderiales bacterium]
MAVAVCSTAFATLARAQAAALDRPALPVALIPHPFGNRTRHQVRLIAEQCVHDIASLVSEGSAVES